MHFYIRSGRVGAGSSVMQEHTFLINIVLDKGMIIKAWRQGICMSQVYLNGTQYIYMQ